MVIDHRQPGKGIAHLRPAPNTLGAVSGHLRPFLSGEPEPDGSTNQLAVCAGGAGNDHVGADLRVSGAADDQGPADPWATDALLPSLSAKPSPAGEPRLRNRERLREFSLSQRSLRVPLLRTRIESPGHPGPGSVSRSRGYCSRERLLPVIRERRNGSCGTCPSASGPARRSPSWGQMARARPPSSSCSRASTTQPAAGLPSMGLTSGTSIPRHCVRESELSSRITCATN